MRLIDADELLMKMNLAIEILEGMKNLGLQDDAECQMELKAYRNIRDGIKDEPTAEPTAQPEPHWIPCTERMPEESEWIGTKTFGTTISDEVYVTFESPDGQRFADHINFQNGKLSRSDEQRMKVIYKGAKPIAWMPLPEPYRGGGKE